LNIGKPVTFEAAGRKWTVQPFSLAIWFEFCEWLKSRPRASDPLERISRLPLDKMPAEMAERLVREAIDEDKQLHDFRPESTATKNALSSVEGIIKVISLLSGEPEDACRDMVLSLAQQNKMEVLTNAINGTIGHIEKKVA
jgi:hypothetical protein